MNRIDWKKKLTSRKFWAAVVGFIAALLTAFAVPSGTVTQVTAVIMAGATLIAYILGEGIVDAASMKAASLTAKDTPVSPATGKADDNMAAIKTGR